MRQAEDLEFQHLLGERGRLLTEDDVAILNSCTIEKGFQHI